MNEKCSTCRFGQDGVCRARPPTVFVIAECLEIKAWWPQVLPNDWCKEWVEKKK